MTDVQYIDTLAPLLVKIDTQIQNDAHALMASADAYAKHVFSGGDPGRLPDGSRSYNNPVSRFMQPVWNAYREAQGMKPNPYHPGSPHAKLFDRLLRAIGEGEPWVAAKLLSGAVMGSRPDTYLKNTHLKQWGWVIEKETRGGKMHYRLVEYSEVTGKKEPANA